MQVVLAGLIVLAIAMGVGRFAYTPLLPVMQAQAGLTNVLAGVLASSNLAGYLAGALIASWPVWRRNRLQVVRWSVALVIVTTALMAIDAPVLWIAVRFATGVASAFAFVLCSSLILDAAAARNASRWPAILYAGVGTGIVATGVFVPPLVAAGRWQLGWLGLAALSTAAAFPALRALREYGAAASQTPAAGKGPDTRFFWYLFAAYGMFGLGYIIPATFLVAMLARAPSVAFLAPVAWIIVGVVAIPSTVFWNEAGLRLGKGSALAIVLGCAALGTVMPVFFPNAFGAVVIAITAGGTFMGATLLGSALARDLFPEKSNVSISRMTAIFGVGQIVGPLVATALLVRTGSYDGALVFAAAVLGVGALATFLGLRLTAARS